MPERNRETYPALLDRLVSKYGEVVGGNDLARCLGFKTPRAFQMAARRQRLPVQIFSVPGRRGHHALTSEVARWVHSLGPGTGQ